MISTKPRSTHTTTAKQQPGEVQLKAELYSSPVKQQQAVVLNNTDKQLNMKDIESHFCCDTDNTLKSTSCGDTTTDTAQVRNVPIHTYFEHQYTFGMKHITKT
jgi:hypothetical protein